MPRPRPTVPPYRHHKGRDLAFTIVGGRTVYLGPWNSPASREKHARVVAEAAAGVPVSVGRAAAAAPPVGLTVAALLAAFWTHAKASRPYDPAYDGRRPPGELGNFHDAMRPVLALYASLPAAEFTPEALEALQQEMIRMGWCRNVVNRQTVRVRTMFKYGVRRKLVPGEVLAQLQTVPAIRKNHRGVRNTGRVLPVPAETLAATLAECPPRLAAMIRVQLYTGMRSGNLCQLRTADVERPAAGAWRYRPRSHKTEHHDHELVIRLGPKARDALAPYLTPDQPEAFAFSPAAALAERRAARTAGRTTPASCGNVVGSNVKRSPRRAPRDHYTPGSYAQAVNRAADRADLAARRRAAEAQGVDPATVPVAAPSAERLVTRWHPHQLRHNRGTAVRAEHGLDGVQAALGQRTVSVAERYAEIEDEKAERIAAELG